MELFMKLPTELRLLVWRETINFTEGVQSINISTEATSPLHYQSGEMWFDEMGNSQHGLSAFLDFERERRTMPCVKADIEVEWHLGLGSFYSTPEFASEAKQLKALLLTCKESSHVAVSAMRELKMITDMFGHKISLDSTKDVFVLDLMSRGYGVELVSSIEIPALEHIRNMSVEYDWLWFHCTISEETCECCGQKHDQVVRLNEPRHIYQFLGRHVPNLERFYIQASLSPALARKRTVEDGPSCPRRPAELRLPLTTSSGEAPPRWRASTYTTTPANDADWVVRGDLIRALNDVRQGFILYCQHSTCSRHENPTAVEFGVLARED